MGNSAPARVEYDLYRFIKRRRLKNKTPTIMASTCLAGTVYHDLKLPFYSPCINIGMFAPDYIKFLKNMDEYLAYKPERLGTYRGDWSSTLGDITLYFAHSPVYEEAVEKWEIRKHRINKDNMFILMTENMGCSYEDLLMFDELPFRNKVVFTHIPYPEIRNSFYVPGFEEEEYLGNIIGLKPGFWKRRWVDVFDIVGFLNGEGIKK